MFSEFIVDFLLQVAFTVGIIFLFGFIIALCNRRFYANFGSVSGKMCIITGIIGTPIHELSHAFFCLLFGHKIVEIKLFQVDEIDGTLGYVNHSYNRKNVYHLVGNFFIGVAPIVVISVLLYFLSRWLLPSFASAVVAMSGAFNGSFTGVLAALWDVVAAFFSGILSWQWWVFLLIGMFLALHMTLSMADIRAALSGLAITLGLLCAADVLLMILNPNYLHTFTGWVMTAGGYLLCFFAIALIIVLILLLISTIVYIIRRKTGRY